MNTTDFTARAAWDRLVELALYKNADALAVAGDVIDASGDYFEASGPLEAGLKRLSSAGIETFFIAGNHDSTSLPRFCDQMKGLKLHLLGSGGRWHWHTLEHAAERLHLCGWSFPEARYAKSPLLGFAPEKDGTPVLGLLHADVDQPASLYGPCSSKELLAAGPGLWLLGHVHGTYEWSGAACRAFYPGSPQALDPGETGAHGAWCAEFDAAGLNSLSFCPLSTIRYEMVVVSLEGCDNDVAAESALREGLRRTLDACATNAGPLKLLSCRVRLQGRTSLHNRLALQGWPRVDELRTESFGITAVVDRVEVTTQPMLDLPSLATGKNPPAMLAKYLLELDRGEHSQFVQGAQEQLASAFYRMPMDRDGEAAAEAEPRQQPPDLVETRQRLRQQGYRLLAQLLAQQS